jgi:hypothetical protein
MISRYSRAIDTRVESWPRNVETRIEAVGFQDAGTESTIAPATGSHPSLIGTCLACIFPFHADWMLLQAFWVKRDGKVVCMYGKLENDSGALGYNTLITSEASLKVQASFPTIPGLNSAERDRWRPIRQG